MKIKFTTMPFQPIPQRHFRLSISTAIILSVAFLSTWSMGSLLAEVTRADSYGYGYDDGTTVVSTPTPPPPPPPPAPSSSSTPGLPTPEKPEQKKPTEVPKLATTPKAAAKKPEAFSKRAPCRKNPFSDISVETYTGLAACDMFQRGVMTPASDGEFHGDRQIDRAQAAKLVLKSCHREMTENPLGTFWDVPPDEWYTVFVESAVLDGIVNGYPDGSFRPTTIVNRAEFLKMFSKACGLPENLDASSFQDVLSDDWFAPFAGAARVYGLFPDSSTDQLLKPVNPMNRNEVAIAIHQYFQTGQVALR